MDNRCGPSLQIGETRVGWGSPVYVVAEAGVNHDGCIDTARRLIVAAAAAGADAVKFQVFSADRLATRQAPAAAYQRDAEGTDSQHEMLARLELGHEQFAELADFARDRGITFLAAPFSIVDLEFLVSIGVPAIKLASPDIVNVPLLEAAASTGLPVIASTGAADLTEVADAVVRFERSDAGPLALLHCISRYPAALEEANLAAIGTLARTFDRVTGYSDHTESLETGGWAVLAGARIVEKHFTLDRTGPGPDHRLSLEPTQLGDYVRHVREAERVLGHGAVEVTATQREVRELARRSVVAACDIAAGEIISRDMLTLKRPGGGLGPAELERLIGRRAGRDLAADTLLSWSDVAEAAAVVAAG